MCAAPISGLIKVNLEHNISSTRIPEVRYDPQQTVLSVKENIEKRYGSELKFMKLILKDEKGNVLVSMDSQNKPLSFYGVQPGHIIHVMDMNPNSIHKEIEDLAKIQKYTISDEDYDKIPENFRKWKKQLHESNPGLLEKINNPVPPSAGGVDDDYMKGIADCMSVDDRCKLSNGCRGTIKYIGKVPGLSYGYYIGVLLDEPSGDNNGIYKGIKYMEAKDKHAIFVRPDTIEIGDFPILEPEDEI